MGHNRTELLLELIANELFLVRMQSNREEETSSLIPEIMTNKLLQEVEKDILDLREHLDMPTFNGST